MVFLGDILVKQTEIKKQEHNYMAFVTEATCISDGYTTYTCSVCNDTYMTDRTIKLGHNMSGFVTSVQPSCEEKGVQISKCSRCNYSETKDIAAKGHIYRDGVCNNCGNSKSDNCSCNCHKGGFMGFIWKIINLFQKLFKINPVCQCGIAHY